MFCLTYVPERTPKRTMELAAIPVLDSPTHRMLTYTLSDEEGAKVILSVRASVADDHLAAEVIQILAAPPRDT